MKRERSDGHTRYSCLNAFGPFLWSILIGLLILGWDFHRRNAPKTTLYFDVKVEGVLGDDSPAVSVTLSGQSVSAGGVVPIGRHILRLSAENTEPVEKTIRVWYGRNEAGSFVLKRHKGKLELSVSPRANRLIVDGPFGYRTVEDDSTGFSKELPVGIYHAAIQFRHFGLKSDIVIRKGKTTAKRIDGSIGAVTVDSLPAGAEFTLRSQEHQGLRVSGRAPMTISELPAGIFNLQIWRDDYQKQRTVKIEKGSTNYAQIRFEYGTLNLDSEPPGTSVYSDEGKLVGKTPVVLKELKPGKTRLRFALLGYETRTLDVESVGNHTNRLTVTLTNARVQQILGRARTAWSGEKPDYLRTRIYSGQALELDPDNEEARRLNVESSYALEFASAKANAEKNSFEESIASLNRAISLKPTESESLKLKATVEEKYFVHLLGNIRVSVDAGKYRMALGMIDRALGLRPAHASTLEFKKNVEAKIASETAAKQRENRKENALRTFEQFAKKRNHAELFDTYNETFRVEGGIVRKAIRESLEKGAVKWALDRDMTTNDGMILMTGSAKTGLLKLQKHFVVLLCDLSAEETLVYGKFWDYGTGKDVKVNLLNRKLDPDSLVPIHPRYYRPDQPSIAKNRRTKLVYDFFQTAKSLMPKK